VNTDQNTTQERGKTSSNWRPVIQQLSISYAPVRSEHRPPVCHPPTISSKIIEHIYYSNN